MKQNHFFLLAMFFSFTLTGFTQVENDPFSELDKSLIKTGFLYNKVKLPVSHINECNGIDKIKSLDVSEWRDIYSEIAGSSITNTFIPYNELKNAVKPKLRQNIFQIGILNISYNAFKEGAFENGLLTVKDKKVYANVKDIYDQEHVFAASLIDTKTYSGLHPTFNFSEKYYYSNAKEKVLRMEVDFDNGEGFRKVSMNETVMVNYLSEGVKQVKLKLTLDNGQTYTAKFMIIVKIPKMPTPNETWTNYTADISYQGIPGKGDIGVFFGNGNTDFTRPVIIVDGFDPGDTRDLADIWDIANQENMAVNLLAEGYDFVIANFYGGDDYIQRNGLLIVKLLQEINTRMINAGTWKEANQIVVIGPSMGGLVTRYALTYMENNNIDHHVRNWIAFDSPMKGANIPLGLQHWVRFFAEVAGNPGAQAALAQLSGPAAKQMLLYHYTATAGNTANPNPLFTSFYNEINTLGFPQDTRIVAIANGAGDAFGQPYYPGDQIIYYSYRSLFINLDGNVWAIPDNTYTKIFNGWYSVPFSNVSENIFVNNTIPYDGAPGGYRNTLKELADNQVSYGDIIAPWDNHCFIPTISSLCIQNTTDAYYNVDENLNNLITPFDKIYYPSDNQEHVKITAESYAWFYHEVINFKPVFTSTPVTSVFEDSVYSYTLAAEDENEWNSLTYGVLAKPNWLSFDAPSGVFTGVPQNSNVGQHYVSVKVTDGLAETYQIFFITVVNTNDPPVITSEPSLTIDEDNLYSYQLVAVDEDPTGDMLTCSAPVLPDWLYFDPNSALLYGTPLNEDVGTHDVTLRVNDGTVDVDQNFTITVMNTNDPPVITSEPTLTIDEDNYYFYQLVAVDEDPTSDMLTYSALVLPDFLYFDPFYATLTGTPLNEDVGIHDVTLRVNDGTVDVDQSFTITVYNTNDPPIITSEPPQTIDEDQFYYYQLVAIDEDPTGDQLSCTAGILPDWLYFDPVFATLYGTPLNEDVGLNDVLLQVSDGTVTVDQNFSITVVNTNDAPELTISVPDQNAQTGVFFEYVFDSNTFTDPDLSDLLFYFAEQSDGDPLPEWLTFNPDDRQFFGTPNEAGEIEIALRAEDLEGAFATDTFIIYVVQNISVSEIGDRVLKIYPIPAHDRLLIMYDGWIKQAEIFNSEGKAVARVNIDRNNQTELKLNLSPGFYFIKFVLETGSTTKKLIIQ